VPRLHRATCVLTGPTLSSFLVSILLLSSSRGNESTAPHPASSRAPPRQPTSPTARRPPATLSPLSYSSSSPSPLMRFESSHRAWNPRGHAGGRRGQSSQPWAALPLPDLPPTCHGSPQTSRVRSGSGAGPGGACRPVPAEAPPVPRLGGRWDKRGADYQASSGAAEATNICYRRRRPLLPAAAAIATGGGVCYRHRRPLLQAVAAC
jgi:hypothetical protein